MTKQGEPEIDPITLSQFDSRENRIELNFFGKTYKPDMAKLRPAKFFFCGPAAIFNAVCVHTFEN